jgi:hypothetical protein
MFNTTDLGTLNLLSGGVDHTAPRRHVLVTTIDGRAHVHRAGGKVLQRGDGGSARGDECNPDANVVHAAGPELGASRFHLGEGPASSITSFGFDVKEDSSSALPQH